MLKASDENTTLFQYIAIIFGIVAIISDIMTAKGSYVFVMLFFISLIFATLTKPDPDDKKVYNNKNINNNIENGNNNKHTTR